MILYAIRYLASFPLAEYDSVFGPAPYSWVVGGAGGLLSLAYCVKRIIHWPKRAEAKLVTRLPSPAKPLPQLRKETQCLLAKLRLEVTERRISHADAAYELSIVSRQFVDGCRALSFRAMALREMQKAATPVWLVGVIERCYQYEFAAVEHASPDALIAIIDVVIDQVKTWH